MLSLNRKTDYALVALAHLAQEPEQTPVSARLLAEEYDMPQPLLAKLMKQLHQAELIDSIRGVEGGYVLAGEPEQITLGQVIEAIEEGPVQIAFCCKEHTGSDECVACRIAPKCPIKGAIRDLNTQFGAILTRLTLADLLSGEVRPAMMDALSSTQKTRQKSRSAAKRR